MTCKRILVAAGVLLALVACGRGPSTSETPSQTQATLRLASFGGSFQTALDKEVVQPVATAAGIKAEMEAYGGEYDRLAATIRSGSNPYDLVHVETRFLIQGAREGLLTPIDGSMVDRSAFVEGAAHPYGVGLLSWALVLAWNGQRLPAGAPAPSGWSDFFDLSRYPGPRALRNSPEGSIELALMADGVPKDTLYQSDLAVERALRKLDTIKSSIAWWSTGAELEQRLASSSVLAAAWNGRAANLKNSAHLPIGWTYTDSVTQFDWWVIPANAANKDLAMKFLAATAKGTGQLAIAEQFGYGPVSLAALDAMSPALRAETPSAPENAALGVPFNGDWWATHQETVAERWNAWLLGIEGRREATE